MKLGPVKTGQDYYLQCSNPDSLSYLLSGCLTSSGPLPPRQRRVTRRCRGCGGSDEVGRARGQPQPPGPGATVPADSGPAGRRRTVTPVLWTSDVPVTDSDRAQPGPGTGTGPCPRPLRPSLCTQAESR